MGLKAILQQVNYIIQDIELQEDAAKERYHNALSQSRTVDAGVERRNLTYLQSLRHRAYEAKDEIKKHGK